MTRTEEIQEALLARWDEEISTALLLEMVKTDTGCTHEEVCEAFIALPDKVD